MAEGFVFEIGLMFEGPAFGEHGGKSLDGAHSDEKVPLLLRFPTASLRPVFKLDYTLESPLEI